jgi:hypothetical protein
VLDKLEAIGNVSLIGDFCFCFEKRKGQFRYTGTWGKKHLPKARPRSIVVTLLVASLAETGSILASKTSRSPVTNLPVRMEAQLGSSGARYPH